jgi:hypothetical protein
MRELKMLPDAVDRQLSAFDVAEEEPEDKLAKQEFERQSPALGFFSGIFFEQLRRGGVWMQENNWRTRRPSWQAPFGVFFAVFGQFQGCFWVLSGCFRVFGYPNTYSLLSKPQQTHLSTSSFGWLTFCASAFWYLLYTQASLSPLPILKTSHP